MKKIVSLLAALALLFGLLCFSACGGIEKYVVRNGAGVQLVLPESKERAKVYGPAEPYLDTLEVDALRATEERLTGRIPKNETGHAFYVAYKDGGMFLGAEVTVPIDPPISEGGGCGIDHDHVFLEEPIRE